MDVFLRLYVHKLLTSIFCTVPDQLDILTDCVQYVPEKLVEDELKVATSQSNIFLKETSHLSSHVLTWFMSYTQ